MTRGLGDVLVAAIVLANTVLIGLALGRYPTTLPPYLPHLALEDAALVIAASAWVARRLSEPAGRPVVSLARCAALTLTLTGAAAIVETYAVAHKG